MVWTGHKKPWVRSGVGTGLLHAPCLVSCGTARFSRTTCVTGSITTRHYDGQVTHLVQSNKQRVGG